MGNVWDNIGEWKLVPYEDEELYEDGELSDPTAVRRKIIWLWEQGLIQLAQWYDPKTERMVDPREK